MRTLSLFLPLSILAFLLPVAQSAPTSSSQAQTPTRQKCLYTCPSHDALNTSNDHSIESSLRLDCGYEEAGVCAYDLRTGHLRRDITSSNGPNGSNCPRRAERKCWDSPKPVVIVRRDPEASSSSIDARGEADELKVQSESALTGRGLGDGEVEERAEEREMEGREAQEEPEWRKWVRDWRYVNPV